MTHPGLSTSLAFLAAAASSLAACGGDGRCDPDAPNTICTIAGTGQHEGLFGDLGPATEAQLYFPIDMAVSPEGELWVLDFNNYVVRAIDRHGVIRTVVGSGLVGSDPPPGVPSVPALEAALNHSSDLAFRDGYLYIAAWHNSQIKRVRLADMTIENYAGRGRRTYYDGDGGPAISSSLDLPASLAFDSAGRLLLMDQENQVVRRIDGDGTIRTVAGRCVTESELCNASVPPVSCFASGGAPGSNKLTCGSLDEDCAWLCRPEFGGDGGPALEARFGQPHGAEANPAGHLAYAPGGDLLISDSGNHRIRRIDPAGIITTIAGTGTRGYAGDGGPATQARLNEPGDLEIDPDGTIYFTDIMNNCVRQIDPAGTISTAVGRCGSEPGDAAFEGDGGPPLEARLNRPFGLHLAGKKLYIADMFNGRIRVVNLP
jgi:DNA-binding beta-propeller fold protein YncE